MVNKYNQINIITLFAMLFIVTIHFFNYFAADITFFASDIIIPIMRGASIIAVPLFVITIGYSHFIQGKKVNFEKMLFFIVIPTILFTSLNHYLFDMQKFYFNLQEGFSGSWFGDMYIGLMLVMPFLLFWFNKNKVVVYVFASILYALSYILSIYVGSATLLDLGLFVFIPYISMVIIYSTITFKANINSKLVLVLIILGCIFLESLAYAGVFENKYYVTSYFSPITMLLACSFYRLIYISNISFSTARTVSQSSYFFYFTSYILLRYFKYLNFDFVIDYPVLTFLLCVVISYILSTVLFILYTKLLTILKLN